MAGCSVTVGVSYGLTVALTDALADDPADAAAADLDAPPSFAEVFDADGRPLEGVTWAEPRPARLSELVPLGSFTPADIDAALVEVRAIRSQLAAFEAVLVERKTAQRPPRPERLPGAREEGETSLDDLVDDWLPDELALVLQTGVTAASGLIERSCALTRQLPATWAALADARIDEGQARMIVSALRDQATGFGGNVADDIVAEIEARAIAWAESGVLPQTLKERIAEAVLAAEKAAADRRRRKRMADADVYVRPTGDGLGDFVVKDLPLEDANAMAATTRAYAHQWKHTPGGDGDPRPIGQLRAQTAKQLILRPWETRPDTDTQVHVRVDLDDLTDHQPGSDSPRGGEPASPSNREPSNAEPADPEPSPRGELTPTPARVPEPADWPFRAPTVDGHPIPPAAVRALLARIDALGLTDPTTGTTQLDILDHDGALLAAATLTELRAAARHGSGLGPPPAVDRYTPSAAQRRFVNARDRHCRMPSCRRPARYCDLDHACPYTCGGATDCPNLCCLCRRHHRLKTHDPHWTFHLDPDGVLHVTTPNGITRTTRPPAIGPPRATDTDAPWLIPLEFDTPDPGDGPPGDEHDPSEFDEDPPPY